MSSLLNNSAILNNKAFAQPFEVKRPSVGAYDGETGKWVEAGEPTTLQASGSIQPVSLQGMGYLKQAVEGGTQVSQAIRIYSQFEFRPGTLGDQASNGDTVVHNGLDWSVVTISDHAAHGHQKVYGVRYDGQDG